MSDPYLTFFFYLTMGQRTDTLILPRRHWSGVGGSGKRKGEESSGETCRERAEKTVLTTSTVHVEYSSTLSSGTRIANFSGTPNAHHLLSPHPKSCHQFRACHLEDYTRIQFPSADFSSSSSLPRPGLPPPFHSSAGACESS